MGNDIKPPGEEENYMVWFFPGGETRDDRFNIFTGSFIKLMKKILGDDFDFIKGVNYRSSIRNVIWALNNAQKPLKYPGKERITNSTIYQIVAKGISTQTQLIIVSSSTGSVIAAQTACCLAGSNANNHLFTKPFHLVLGASMINPFSELYKCLIRYQKEGKIGLIIHDEIQDEGDNSAGVGGLTRFDAYRNAFGIMFPMLSVRFKGPSFLNAHPEKGHIHRTRSQSIQKAMDYIHIILIKHMLAGIKYKEKAVEVLALEKGKEATG